MTEYKTGEVPNCPHCGKTLEEPIENFTIPGRLGVRSRSEGDCGWCDGLFDAEKISEDTFTLTPKSGKR